MKRYDWQAEPPGHCWVVDLLWLMCVVLVKLFRTSFQEGFRLEKIDLQVWHELICVCVCVCVCKIQNVVVMCVCVCVCVHVCKIQNVVVMCVCVCEIQNVVVMCVCVL